MSSMAVIREFDVMPKRKATLMQRRTLLSVAIVLTFLIVSCGNGSSKNCDDGTFKVGEILVSFNDGVTEDQANGLIEGFGLTSTNFIKELTLASVTVPDCTEDNWIAAFERENIVSYAELNYIGHGALASDERTST